MRATFIVNEDNHAQSDIRPKGAPHVIAVGTPVALSAAYRTPYGIVPKGAKGFVSAVDEDNGSVWILMEGLEPALALWDNMLLLMPYDTEELLAVVEFKRAPPVLWRRLGDYLRLAAATFFVLSL
jgi:hypothetical protein